ncbi:MAG: hypothetical protein J5863_09625, partial [Desulfovibrio sp.]|nr:hypothetical protein [Desulfovibrio sp.]
MDAANLGCVTPAAGKGVNLLDNWYFPNPVNQRGQTVYTFTSSANFAIDRWMLGNISTSYNESLTLNDGYITISGTGGLSMLFNQQCEDYVWNALL